MHTVRMLLDSGSMSHFITTKCCYKLGIPIRKVSTSVGGIGSTKSEVKGVTTFTIHSRFDIDKSYLIDQAFVVDKITNKLPICPVDADSLFSHQELNLSDDEFHVPGDIDGLIGAELFTQIYGKHKTLSKSDGPVVIESTLGDIVMGKIPVLPSSSQGNEDIICSFVEAPLEYLVQKFWSLEEVPTPKTLCQDDEKCEQIFCDTSCRRDDGRYTVSLPFKSDPALLGDSYKIAEKRFLNLERKLSSNPEVKEQYKTAITEYIKEGYAVPSEPKSDLVEFYMPHHAIYRPDRVTTKVRVVFDLSCPTSNGTSLNDILLTGPTLYNDLFELLLKMRHFPVLVLADIKKMFLQIYVKEEDRRFQKFLWRNSPQEELKAFEMQRVVFGMKPSPYLAQRVLHQVAADDRQNHPEAAHEIQSNFYMDDYLSSFLDEDQAVSTFSDCVEVLKKGGFELTKLTSNNVKVLESVPENQRLMEKVEWDRNSSLKVLGTQYCPAEDKFFFTVNIQDTRCTKRNILSTAARIFDVLSLISPITILVKLLIKELWLAKIDWDKKAPASVEEKWIRFIADLPLLCQFQVPRHLIARDTELSVIGFCDASEKAIGACIYVQVVSSTFEISSRLLCAKSKVAPVKYVTIPRLELCSSLLIFKLMSFILKTFITITKRRGEIFIQDLDIAEERLLQELLKQRIEFHFNPPTSPHHGGLGESNIRQVKNHLYKAIGSQILTFEEMNTLTSEIESILNKRPLVQISSDCGDPVVLTPSHFLLQEPHMSLTHVLDFQSASLGMRYKLISQLLHSFWKRWSLEYLSSLQSRKKWFQDADQQLRVGQMVLIKSDNDPVSCWSLARVVQLFSGKDKLSRVALVQTKSGVYKRPAVLSLHNDPMLMSLSPHGGEYGRAAS
ncbi:hypothetical protein WDU94_001902 [Cyamophila willieti]